MFSSISQSTFASSYGEKQETEWILISGWASTEEFSLFCAESSRIRFAEKEFVEEM